MSKNFGAMGLFLLSVLCLSCDFGVSSDPPDHGTYFRVEPDSASIAEERSLPLAVKTDCKMAETVYRIHYGYE